MLAGRKSRPAVRYGDARGPGVQCRVRSLRAPSLQRLLRSTDDQPDACRSVRPHSVPGQEPERDAAQVHFVPDGAWWKALELRRRERPEVYDSGATWIVDL